MFCFKRGLIVLALLAFFTSPTSAQQPFLDQQSFQSGLKNSTEGYDPSFGRQSLQVGAGVLFGAAGGVAGFFGGAILAPNAEGPGGLVTLGYAAIGTYIGYSASSAFGIYIAANSNSYNASLGNIFLGHGIGAAAGLGSIFFMDAVDGPQGPAIVLALAAPIVGGIIANKKSIQKRKKISSTSALLNISNGNTKLASPSVRFPEVGNFDLLKKRSATVKLLNISL